MRGQEPAGTDRRRPWRRVFRRLAAGILAGAVAWLPAAAWAADASAGRGGAGGAMPSFVLQNLLALAMSLTVLVIACKRFRRE